MKDKYKFPVRSLFGLKELKKPEKQIFEGIEGSLSNGELGKSGKALLGAAVTLLTAQLVYWTLSVVPGIGEYRFFDSARETVQFSVLRDHGMNPRNLEIFSDYNGTADYKTISQYLIDAPMRGEEQIHKHPRKEDFPDYY